MKVYDIIILGAGASGLMCASFLDKKFKIAIVDSNAKVAQKLKISGGGKCNITNVDVSVDNFEGEIELISKVLESFSRDDLLEFLKVNNVSPVIRKDRYYFCKNSSDEIINVLKQKTKNSELILNSKVIDLEKKDNIFNIKTNKTILKAKKLIIATGAKSFANLGASDIGLKLAKKFDIQVKEFTPALVGLTLQKDQFWMKELSGLSIYVHIKVQNKTLKEDMLFAHKGISGPAILSASLYWKRGLMSIDFLPNDNIFDLVKGGKKLISSVMNLPKRFSKALLLALNIPDIECKKITKEIQEKLKLIHNYEFAPAGNFGFTKAEVCSGGVLADELIYESLESKKIKDLHFLGEIVDVTGELGGYNFQWAFSSAVMCAKNINTSF
ncbi:MAG: aminoacetone oxidase family FAD-binding enzyme [Sulfurimonas sp.]|nr:MAG: aminoacetone oxidase family FAD-binding enzyme [Sulfurimonas sp.]